MTLPTVKNKKLINREEFVKLAKKVEKSFEEEVHYLHEKKIKNENNTSPRTYSMP